METLWPRQIFPSLAAREACVAETNFVARKQKVFLPEVETFVAPWTQILCSKHKFSSLAKMKAMSTRLQSCS